MPAPASVLLVVRRVAARPRHGGFEQYGSTEYLLENGKLVAQDYFGRHFTCPCGEVFNDGDPYVDTPRGPVHSNCYTGD